MKIFSKWFYDIGNMGNFLCNNNTKLYFLTQHILLKIKGFLFFLFFVKVMTL